MGIGIPLFLASGLCTKAIFSALQTTNTATDLEARISVANSTGRLDLSDCGLVEIPPEVFELSDVVDLSLAGNSISNLPEEIQNLQKLERLGLAGNALRTLPENIGKLSNLQGLWLQGNLLQSLPPEICQLEELRTLALAGNILTSLPPSLNKLKRLQIFSVAGNNLAELPDDFGSLSSLRVLALYGNLLSQLPESFAHMPALEDLWLQGNMLEYLPPMKGLVSLKQLSVADNQLKSLPNTIGGLQSLETLSLYGNQLSELPKTVEDMTSLKSMWLEGNPFEIDSLRHFSLPDNLKAIGLSSNCAIDTSCGSVYISQVAGTGNAATHGGYFKLQRYTERSPSSKEATVVVVAFGSAPAVPNWGGLLNRVKKDMESDGILPAFDILYVVDSWRSWYTKQKIKVKHGNYYKNELEAAVKHYKRVIMLGDSMGASAALMFSPLATSVIAFCPQVDLQASSIRPGEEKKWLEDYKKALIDAVLVTNAEIQIHCGSWSHDCYQARCLPESKVKCKVHNVNTHRLAKEMDSRGLLVPLVKMEITHALCN